MTVKPQILKKLNLKIKYLTLELEEVKDAFQQYLPDFNAYLVSLEQTYKIQIFNKKAKKIKKSSKKNQDDEIVNLKRDKKQADIFKTLYRDIAREAHPDKTGDDKDKTRLMRQATRAKNSDDLMTLLDICDVLDVDTPSLDDEHIKIIEKNVKHREDDINRHKNLDAWIWGDATDRGDDKKLKAIEKAIVKRFT
jgi:hypothetical protein